MIIQNDRQELAKALQYVEDGCKNTASKAEKQS